MGDMSSFTWNRDPKRLLFVLSRYKAVASMLDDETHVLEVGCGDAFGSRIVKQFVKDLTVSDADCVDRPVLQHRECTGLAVVDCTPNAVPRNEWFRSATSSHLVTAYSKHDAFMPF